MPGNPLVLAKPKHNQRRKNMPHETVNLPVQSRAALFKPETLDEERRTIEMVWSTGTSVRRHDFRTGKPFDEVLSLDPAHVDLSRLNAGAPLLDSHKAWNLGGVIGVVENARIEGDGDNQQGRALVRFSERDEVTPIWNDVKDGILRAVSVGYRVRSYEITEEEGQIPVWRAVDWQPMELSAVPVGADAGAGFRSSDKSDQTCQLVHQDIEGPKKENKTMAIEQPQEERAHEEESTMALNINQKKTRPKTDDDLAKPVNPVDHARLAEKAVAQERSRIAGIFDSQSKLGVERSVADDLVKRGISLDDSRKHLIDEAANQDSATNIRSHIVVAGELDEKKTRRVAVETALMHRFDPSSHEMTDAATQWRGMTLLEMARHFLEAEGTRMRGMSRDEIATRSLQTTSDFPMILVNVANKTLRKAYKNAPRTFQSFCRQVTASDFKSMQRVQLGEAPSLEKINESGEYHRGALGETQESYRVETYGKIISISRQVLINDDLDAFTRIPQLFGVAAANLESDVVWSIFTSNPKMGDNTALFHTNHKNLASTASPLSMTSVGKGRAAMSKQVGLDGKTVLNVRPAYLIVPAALEMTAEQMVAQNMMPSKTTDVVPQSVRTLSVIPEARLDTASETAWYLIANPNQIDTIEYAYLEGQTGVYIETRVGFDVDGVEIKARLDFGAKAIDWRGMYKNSGQ
jgi:phage major head subunit gpT-like protein